MTTPTRSRRGDVAWWLAVVGISLVGLVFRGWNLDWDERQHLQVDETDWGRVASVLAASPAPPAHGTVVGPMLDWLDGQRSPANPYRGSDSFVHGGGATLAAARATAGWLHAGATEGAQPAALIVNVIDFLGIPLLTADGAPRFDDAWNVDLVGRLLGAVADSAAVVVIAVIGRRLGGRLVGLAAAAFHALSVMAIQQAHVLGAEPWLVLAAAVCVLLTLRIDRAGNPRRAAVTGAVAGLAAGATLAVKASGAGIAVIPIAGCAWLAASRRRRADWLRLAACLLGAVVAFRVLNPAAFDGLGVMPSDGFWGDLRRQRELTRSNQPWLMRWAGTIPIVEALRWIVLYYVGPGTAASALCGVTILVRRRRTIGRWSVAVVVAATVLPLTMVFLTPVQNPRYGFAMLPGLHVCAGYGLVKLAGAARRWFSERRHRRATTASVATMTLGGLTVLWAAAFVAGVYGHEHTQLAAARWLVTNAAPGSVVSVQYWDRVLPLRAAGAQPDDYSFASWDTFPADSVEKVQGLADHLAGVDFVVEASPMMWRHVPQIPARYPSTIRLYEELDSGELGFTRVATFTSPPRLGPFRLNSTLADLSFWFDHPEVRIWQRVGDVPRDEMVAALDPVAAANALNIHQLDGHTNGLMLYDGELAANAEIGTYAGDFDLDGNPVLQALGWLLVLHLVGAAALAIFAPLLRRLPDLGAGAAPTIGIVVVAFGVFVAVAWLGFAFTRGVMATVAGLWVAAGSWCVWRGRSRLRGVWQRRRGDLLRVELTMLVSFGLWLLARALNADDAWHPLAGSEKPFELASLTSLLRTRTLPPYDVWFAGGSLNYYYGGYLLLAVPARLLRTTPALALNLGVPTIGMLAAGAAYTAGNALAIVGRPAIKAVDGAVRRFARRAGLFAVGWVMFVPSAAILEYLIKRSTGNAGDGYDWLSLLYVLPGMGNRVEFPGVAMLSFNVHAHVLDLAVLLALIAVAAAWFAAIRGGDSMVRVVALGGLVGLLMGMTRATNTWDFPLAVAVATMAGLGGLLAPGDGSVLVAWRQRWRKAAAGGATALAVVVVGWAPYWWRAEAYSTGLVAAESRTPFAGWLTHWGILAAATTVGVLDVVIVAIARGSVRTGAVRRQAVTLALVGALALAVAAAFAIEAGRTAQAVSVGLAAGCAAAAWFSRRMEDSSAGPPAFALASVGWGIVAGIESIQIEGDFGGRFNTVFKGWFHAWVVIAVAVAVILAALVRRISVPARWSWFGTAAARATVVVAAITTAAFVVLAVPSRIDDRLSDRGLSLDGLGFLDAGADFRFGDATVNASEDRPLIEWLQHNVAGTPTIAEVPGVSWTWSSRFSTLTGLPTVLGWKTGHEYLQRRRYWGAIDRREADVKAFYESADPAAITSVLQQYDIEYVVFGTLERSLAGPAGRVALLAYPCLQVEYEHDDLFIAAVDQSCVADQRGALPVDQQ
jgi:YYY domain-containing protein